MCVTSQEYGRAAAARAQQLLALRMLRTFLCVRSVTRSLMPRSKRPRPARIGTHGGTFHCDDALACFLLKLLPSYKVQALGRARAAASASCEDARDGPGGWGQNARVSLSSRYPRGLLAGLILQKASSDCAARPQIVAVLFVMQIQPPRATSDVALRALEQKVKRPPPAFQGAECFRFVPVPALRLNPRTNL